MTRQSKRGFLSVPVLLGVTIAPAADAQSPAFEVASVKTASEPARDLMFCIGPCTFGERLTVVGPRVDIRFMSLFNLILTAYRIKPYQLSGPDWMRSQKFDIAAKIPGQLTQSSLPEMLQALLAERFKLTIHRATSEQPVYALVVGKNGSKLQPSAAGDPVPDAAGSQALYTPQGDGRQLADGTLVITAGPYGPMRGGRGSNGVMKFEFLKITMPALAELLTAHLDRPAVDRTSLTGSYYLASVNHPPSGEGGGRKGGPPEAGPGAPESSPPPNPFAEGLFTAVENAGLKLEKNKAPVEMIIVDHLEKTPTAN